MDRIESARLAEYGTFRLGGPCRALMDCHDPRGLREAVQELHASGTPYVLIGGGSNLLISDQGFDGVVVRYAETDAAVERVGDTLEVPGSMQLDVAARSAAEQGLEGLTCCTGIPGTVGGAIVGNAGAWGRQIGDSLVEVTLLGKDGRSETVGAADLGLGYRRSLLQRDGRIVVSARLAVTPADSVALMAERKRILAVRAEKHPDLATMPCIGSIFRNIEPTSAAGRREAAGWFLERAGAGDMVEGGAEVFAKHANIIVARDGCTAQNVRDLIRRMAAAVRETFDFDLVREVRYLGHFEGEARHPGYF